MKKILLILMLIGISVLGYSQDNSAEQEGAKIVFNAPVFNFDTIMCHASAECSFIFTNQGTEPLLVTSAFSSCGCTVPSWPKEPVMPNATDTITVRYNTSKIGEFNKVIVVKSNSIVDAKLILRIKGVVKESDTKKESVQ